VRTFFTDQRLAVREDPVTGSFNAAESNQASSFARERIAHAICS